MTEKIPQLEHKEKVISLRLSEKEYKAIKDFCRKHKTNPTILIRFKLNELIPEIKQ